MRGVGKDGGADLFGGAGAGEPFPDLFGTFIAKIGAAEHQYRRDRPGQEGAQQQRDRQDDRQLVDQRSLGDLGNDRQFAIGRKPGDVARRYRGIVDHDARRLHSRAPRAGGDIVDRGGGELGNYGNVIE